MKDFFLTTQRLGFSIWCTKDKKEALSLWGNPAVTELITAGGKMNEEQVYQRLEKEIETYNNFHIQYWPLYLKESFDNIGCCGLRPYDMDNNILELGIHLKDSYWGKGFAKEACSAVIEYAFKKQYVNGLFAGHNPKNISSKNLLLKLGFKYTHDEFYPPTGLLHPSYIMTRSDYLGKIENI